MPAEWPGLFLSAPIAALKKPPDEKLYIVEADCDRVGEGKFLSEFLKPGIVLWPNSARSHAVNFEKKVKDGEFKTVEQAIAFEFGCFLKECRDIAFINGDNPDQIRQEKRTHAQIREITKDRLLNTYRIDKNGTSFRIEGIEYTFSALLPKDVFYAVAMCRRAVTHLGLSFDETFSKFVMPAGRGSLFAGIHDITIIDSCYNANLSSMEAVLAMFALFPCDKKWLVLGDMLEQGIGEGPEHEKLAEIVKQFRFSRIILLGPRVKKYAYQKLKSAFGDAVPVDAYDNPVQVLDFIKERIQGGETILFKGARFMEGIIEHLLKDKNDAKFLPRRERVWELRRKQWGL
jgi:UDP-N-acetylmuramoyl-tripeptide--D-alanyl-D-alanine ligase